MVKLSQDQIQSLRDFETKEPGEHANGGNDNSPFVSSVVDAIDEDLMWPDVRVPTPRHVARYARRFSTFAKFLAKNPNAAMFVSTRLPTLKTPRGQHMAAWLDEVVKKMNKLADDAEQIKKIDEAVAKAKEVVKALEELAVMAEAHEKKEKFAKLAEANKKLAKLEVEQSRVRGLGLLPTPANRPADESGAKFILALASIYENSGGNTKNSEFVKLAMVCWCIAERPIHSAGAFSRWVPRCLLDD